MIWIWLMGRRKGFEIDGNIDRDIENCNHGETWTKPLSIERQRKSFRFILLAKHFKFAIKPDESHIYNDRHNELHYLGRHINGQSRMVASGRRTEESCRMQFCRISRWIRQAILGVKCDRPISPHALFSYLKCTSCNECSQMGTRARTL